MLIRHRFDGMPCAVHHLLIAPLSYLIRYVWLYTGADPSIGIVHDYNDAYMLI